MSASFSRAARLDSAQCEALIRDGWDVNLWGDEFVMSEGDRWTVRIAAAGPNATDWIVDLGMRSAPGSVPIWIGSITYSGQFADVKAIALKALDERGFDFF